MRGPADKQTIQIKLEVDTNLPAQSTFQTCFLDFPSTFSIVAQDLPSLFAGKCHALLCRPYVKGRDWFDFVWYVSKKVIPNYAHLASALEQMGPWQNKKVDVTADWLVAAFNDKVAEIDWNEAKKDAENFLQAKEREGLQVWGRDFFFATVEKMAGYLAIKN